MKLYIGGAYQGQEELARKENPDAALLTDFHETVRQALRRGEDGAAVAGRILREQPDAVIVANEIGAGIVPMEAEDRAWREAVALPFPGGESRAAFSARCVRAYAALPERDCALIVHGGTIMAIMEAYARPRGGYYDFQLPCGEGYILEENGRFRRP